MKDETKAAHAGRDPFSNYGIVNPPVYHASTVLFPTYEALNDRTGHKVVYGRRGTPTTFALQDAMLALEGGAGCAIVNSGLAAITTALLSLLATGDKLLMVDSVYGPTRIFCEGILKRMGVETVYYDPTIGGGIADLMDERTKVVFVESPGSITFEMQDIPAIAAAAKAKGVKVVMDNTWASPLFFKPFEHGVNVSLQAATKYVVGHADAMLGTITADEETWPLIQETWNGLGQCGAPDDIYLALRGIRTLDVRLRRHMAQGIEIAKWLETRDEVKRVMHPALPSHPGHELWKRDFLGACGLFAFVLKPPVSEKALAAMLDGLKLFGMGYSWGGFESLLIPVDPKKMRTVIPWDEEGQLLRIHVGLESVDDLKTDLEAALDRFKAAS